MVDEAVGLRDSVAEWLSRADDHVLVRRASEGDEVALDALYRRYARPVYSLVLRMLQDEELTQEVVQDAFLRVWRKGRDYDPSRAQFSSWLLGIAHNLAIDQLRRRRVRPIPAPDGAIGPNGLAGREPKAEDPVDDPVAELERGDLAYVVREALHTLPGPQRAAIELAYFGGLSQSEIAATTGVPLGTVKSRIRFGMQAMQGALARHGFGPRGAGAGADSQA